MCLGGEIFKFPLIYSEEIYLLQLLVLVKIRQLALVTGASKVRLYKNKVPFLFVFGDFFYFKYRKIGKYRRYGSV